MLSEEQQPTDTEYAEVVVSGRSRVLELHRAPVLSKTYAQSEPTGDGGILLDDAGADTSFHVATRSAETQIPVAGPTDNCMSGRIEYPALAIEPADERIE